MSIMNIMKGVFTVDKQKSTYLSKCFLGSRGSDIGDWILAIGIILRR